jgi:hypothetical protein
VNTKCPPQEDEEEESSFVFELELARALRAESKKNPAVSGFGARTSLTVFNIGAAADRWFLPAGVVDSSKKDAPGGLSPSAQFNSTVNNGNNMEWRKPNKVNRVNFYSNPKTIF